MTHYYKVVKLPNSSYCHLDLYLGDLFIKCGDAYNEGWWTENDDPNDYLYMNVRTGHIINETLLTDKGEEYFKRITFNKNK